jgi:hypothetical protein
MTANRSGNPAKRNTAKPTSVSAWKKNNEVPLHQLPSGNYIRIRKIGMQGFMKLGMIPNALMPFIEKGVNKGKGAAPAPNELDGEMMASMLTDQNALREMAEFFDKMVVAVCAEPTVALIPMKNGEELERDPDQLYVDEIDEEDKSFIFQLCTGGTTDVEQFRAERDSAMELVQGLPDLQLPTE